MNDNGMQTEPRGEAAAAGGCCAGGRTAAGPGQANRWRRARALCCCLLSFEGWCPGVFGPFPLHLNLAQRFHYNVRKCMSGVLLVPGTSQVPALQLAGMLTQQCTLEACWRRIWHMPWQDDRQAWST